MKIILAECFFVFFGQLNTKEKKEAIFYPFYLKITKKRETSAILHFFLFLFCFFFNAYILI